MDRNSVNWFAEMFAKRIGLDRFGAPGTIAKGSRAIRTFASKHGVSVKAFDGSGLSFANRVSPAGLVKLLHWARRAAWGPTFMHGLATGGQGTLEDRLLGVKVRAKTGTLDWVSALSGYVWLQRDQRWAEFSILDSGMYKSTAVSIEDRIVRILFNYAHSG
jgi:D-alanyl-D-alanine carboxypeptidase/D-alanyl-D-alanine-endopeptidase (penicillin-binding protein 4)